MSGKRLTSKQWLIMFAVLCIVIAVFIAALNYFVDPFGAFGDKYMTWWSYDETNNPRVAKISYLEENHEKYDSYVIGCSSTSSFPVETLNEHMDASFYNLIMYGADMLDVEQTCDYLIENYKVKNIVLNVYLDNGMHYDTEPDSLTYGMHYKVDGSSKLEYYFKYLSASPAYAVSKIKSYAEDTYLQQSFDVFDEETGAYDKTRRDAEGIDDLESYLEDYPMFANYYFPPEGALDAVSVNMESIARIKHACEKAGVNLIVVTAPVYKDYIAQFDPQAVGDFYTALAEVTDYWDFSYSSVSCDPRYFYDETHFRNCVGDMAIARIFGDDSVYIPEDFGTYVTAENAAEHFTRDVSADMPTEEDYTSRVPILMYHHLAEEGDGGDTIAVSVFDEQIKALYDAGYTAVLFDDLYNYVHYGTELPEKAVVITFDDGYESNYSLAMPILEKYGMKATVFAIGVSIGKATYKDTGKPMFEHFSLDKAREMLASGVFDIQSHGYDLHQVSGLDTEPIRAGILQLEGENEKDYIAAVRKDCWIMNEMYEKALGQSVTVFAYPYGFRSELSSMLLTEHGIYATVTTEEKHATIIKGMPQSLLDMGRFFIKDEHSGQELLELIR